MPYFAYKIKNTIDKRFKDVQEKFSDISEKVQENISGIRVVKGFNMSEQQEKTFSCLCRDYVKKYLSLAIPQSLLGPVFEYLNYLGIIILLLVGGGYGIGRFYYIRYSHCLPELYFKDGLAHDGCRLVSLIVSAR